MPNANNKTILLSVGITLLTKQCVYIIKKPFWWFHLVRWWSVGDALEEVDKSAYREILKVLS